VKTETKKIRAQTKQKQKTETKKIRAQTKQKQKTKTKNRNQKD
jgi:hypothetical protein